MSKIPVQGVGTAGLGAWGGGVAWAPGLADTHFLPDWMKRSYSTAILQDKAWRLWAAEQLVLTTLPVHKGRGL